MYGTSRYQAVAGDIEIPLPEFGKGFNQSINASGESPAMWCFEIMKKSLRFNIGKLETSYLFDKDVADLQEKNQAIPEDLCYACLYWGEHLSQEPSSHKALSTLHDFLRYRLLFWMEVLNLKGWIGHGEDNLTQGMKWLSDQINSVEIRQFLYEARNFVITFATSPASLSTPHIYISTLPFTPEDGYIWEHYRREARGLLSIEVPGNRGAAALATWDVGTAIHAIAQSCDGKRIFCGASNGSVIIWNVSTGTLARELRGSKDDSIWTVALSPDGTRIASSGRSRAIYLWDANSGKHAAGPCKGHTKLVCAVAFSPDGTRLVSGSEDCTIRMWNTSSGAQLGEPLEGHQDCVTSINFSANGLCLVSGSYDSTIRIWDLQRGANTKSLRGHTDRIYSISISPDGLRLASGSRDRTIRIWSMHEGTALLHPLIGHTRDVSSVSFSPDGLRLASGSWDNTICIWDTIDGTLLTGPIGGHHDWVSTVHFSPDGARIISGSVDGTICMRDVASLSEHSADTRNIRAMAVSRDCTQVALGSRDCAVYIRNVTRDTAVVGPLKGHTEDITSIGFSPDGSRVVSGSNDGTLILWRASDGVQLVGPFQGHTDWVRAAVFSSNGSLIASCSDDCTIRIWDSATGKQVTSPVLSDTHTVTSIAFSPTGTRLVSGTAGRTVRMWDVSESGSSVWATDKHAGRVNCVTFSRDGTRVASGSDDMTVRVWSSDDGSVLHGPFVGHSHGVRLVTFSPDGSKIVSTSSDYIIRVFDVKDGTLTNSFHGHSSQTLHAYFSNDTQIISGSDNGTLRFWNTATPRYPSYLAFENCVIQSDGWMVDSKSRIVLWVPAALRSSMPLPFSPSVSCPEGTIRANYTDLRLGSQWQHCYSEGRLKYAKHYSSSELQSRVGGQQRALAGAYLRVLHMPPSVLQMRLHPLQMRFPVLSVSHRFPRLAFRPRRKLDAAPAETTEE